MIQKIKDGSVAFSLAALLTGCASGPYTQVQLGYANSYNKDAKSNIDLLCTRVRGGAKIGAKEPSEAEVNERRDLIIRKIKNRINSYFQQNPDDSRKKEWSNILESEKEGGKIVLKLECDGNLYFGLDGINQVLDPSKQDLTNNVLDLAERIPNYTVPLGAKSGNKNYAFTGLPPPLSAAENCDSAKSSTKHEFRLGADICYGKLPSSLSQKTYSVDVPLVGQQQTDVYGTTKSSLVKVSIPFIEYRYVAIEGNFPGDGLARIGLRSPDTKDVSLGMWAAFGYDIDIKVSETDYTTSGGSLENIPGANVKGRFYGEFTNEITLFGKVPLSMSTKIDAKDGYVSPVFSGGYRIQW